MQERFAFYLWVNVCAALGSALYLVSFTLVFVWEGNIITKPVNPSVFAGN